MDFIWHVIIMINMWIPIVLAWSLIFGKGKIFHFGPAGVSLAAAYGIFLVQAATGSYVLGVITGLSLALLISLLLWWLSLRLDQDGLGVMSIAVHLIIYSIVINWTSVTRGALGIPRIPRIAIMESMSSFAIVSGIASLIWIVFALWFSKSSFGRQVEALAEHEWHAKSLGINRPVLHLILFVFVAFAVTTDAFIFGQYIHLITPHDFHFFTFIFMVTIVVAGKPGSVWGVVLSTCLLIILRESLRFLPIPLEYIGPLRLILFGVVLILAVWYRKNSMFPAQRTV